MTNISSAIFESMTSRFSSRVDFFFKSYPSLKTSRFSEGESTLSRTFIILIIDSIMNGPENAAGSKFTVDACTIVCVVMKYLSEGGCYDDDLEAFASSCKSCEVDSGGESPDVRGGDVGGEEGSGLSKVHATVPSSRGNTSSR